MRRQTRTRDLTPTHRKEDANVWTALEEVILILKQEVKAFSKGVRHTPQDI